MSIECVTFDLDDTLWHIGPVIARAEKHFYDWLREHCPRIAEAEEPESLVADRRAYMQRWYSLD